MDFAPQPVVAIQDVDGNTVTTAASATVTLSFAPETPSNDLTCTPGNTRTTSAGVATFTGCNIKKAATYQLVASVPGYTTVTGTSFTLQ